MKIQKFDTYNESLRDKMTGKSDEEVQIAIKKLLEELKGYSQNPKEHAETFVYYLRLIYPNNKELLIALIENGILDAADIVTTITDDLDYPDENETERGLEKHMKYKSKVMQGMYKLIEDNIDKLDIEELNSF